VRTVRKPSWNAQVWAPLELDQSTLLAHGTLIDLQSNFERHVREEVELLEGNTIAVSGLKSLLCSGGVPYPVGRGLTTTSFPFADLIAFLFPPR
jgi:hypothetical protein